jgi:predicted site-specific integrase-resolvase
MENAMGAGKAAHLLGVSVKTLQRWEREGRLIPAARSDSNRRLYTENQLCAFQGLRQSGGVAPMRVVAYCRSSMDDIGRHAVKTLILRIEIA